DLDAVGDGPAVGGLDADRLQGVGAPAGGLQRGQVAERHAEAEARAELVAGVKDAHASRREPVRARAGAARADVAAERGRDGPRAAQLEREPARLAPAGGALVALEGGGHEPSAPAVELHLPLDALVAVRDQRDLVRPGPDAPLPCAAADEDAVDRDARLCRDG